MEEQFLLLQIPGMKSVKEKITHIEEVTHFFFFFFFLMILKKNNKLKK